MDVRGRRLCRWFHGTTWIPMALVCGPGFAAAGRCDSPIDRRANIAATKLMADGVTEEPTAQTAMAQRSVVPPVIPPQPRAASAMPAPLAMAAQRAPVISAAVSIVAAAIVELVERTETPLACPATSGIGATVARIRPSESIRKAAGVLATSLPIAKTVPRVAASAALTASIAAPATAPQGQPTSAAPVAPTERAIVMAVVVPIDFGGTLMDFAPAVGSAESIGMQPLEMASAMPSEQLGLNDAGGCYDRYVHQATQQFLITHVHLTGSLSRLPLFGGSHRLIGSAAANPFCTCARIRKLSIPFRRQA